MARLWSCGFELQSTTAGIEWPTTTGSPTISTTIFRSGAAAMRCNTSAAAANIAIAFHGSGSDANVYARTYMYIASAPSAITEVLKFSGSVGSSLRLATNRTIELYDGSVGKVGISSFALNLGQWYRLELEYRKTSERIHGYINGVEFSSDVKVAENTTTLLVGNITAVTTDLYFDDVALNDNTGASQTGLPGSGSIVHLRPSGTGDNSGGTYTGAATGWETTDEITPDDVTTYTALTVIATDILDVALDDSSVPGINSASLITLVQVGARWRAATTATCNLQLRIKSQASGTIVTGTNITNSTSATWSTHDDSTPRIYKLTSYTDPQGGGVWTPGLLDTTQIGIISDDVTPNPQVSTLWALVEYRPFPNYLPHNVNNYKFASSVSAGIISVTEKIR